MVDDTSDRDSDDTAVRRRDFLGLASVSSLVLLAGCAESDSSGLSVSEDGRLVVSDVENVNLSDGVTVVDTEGKSVTLGTTSGQADSGGGGGGGTAADSIMLGTGDSLVFGDNGEVTATYDGDTGRVEVSGGVQISDGEFKGPYDTNQYVHDLILPGMHAYSTDAVGVQDNVLGYADEWATVSHTDFSDGGDLKQVFKPGPSGWAGWNQPRDFPAKITVEGLEQDFAPGRAMVMFRPDAHAGAITLETRTEGGSWELAARITGNTSNTVVLDPDDMATPVRAVRWTFAEPSEGGSIRLQNLFYYSMSIKGNTWLPKERGETTGVTFLPTADPETPDEGATLFAPPSGNGLAVKLADGSESPLSVDARSPELAGTVSLRDGRAAVPTGISEPGTHLSVSLDPTGDGANDAPISVTSAVRWEPDAGEYCVDIIEQETDIGDPEIGYRVWEQ